jgi:hypothetical protein
MSTEPNIRLRTEIAAKVLPELVRYYVEANGKLPPDSEVKADLYREALSYADGLMAQAQARSKAKSEVKDCLRQLEGLSDQFPWCDRPVELQD